MVAEHRIKVKTNLFHELDELPKLVDLADSGKMQGKSVVVVDKECDREGERCSGSLRNLRRLLHWCEPIERSCDEYLCGVLKSFNATGPKSSRSELEEHIIVMLSQ